MTTNKFFLLIAASVMSVALASMSAMADTVKPEAYQQLTAVELKPAYTPRLAHGFSDLSGSERRYQEQLPVQLDGAIKKVKSAKYKPGHKSKGKKHLRKSPRA